MAQFDESKDYYETLKVASTADEKEITAAYKKLVLKYHPDKHQGNELEDLAKEKLEQLNEAYKVLSDKNTRIKYDSIRRAQNSRQNFRSSAHCAPSAPPSNGGKILGLITRWGLLGLLGFIGTKAFRSPRALMIILALMAAVYLAPRIKNSLKK
ncbi:MAG: J domain-containing protein [Deltaproteobacteria bacterium]|nr:J domain-containing protein [Deltaproteobacteria bacterium]